MPDTIASLRGWLGHHPGAARAQYSLEYRAGVSRPGTSLHLYSRPGRTVPRDVRPWQDVASARARARELAPKIHAARRRVIAHHEAGHLIVLPAERRAFVHTDATDSIAEEDATCYLQIVLADELPGVGRLRLMTDMDAWGYSFRLGSTQAWFEQDAENARQWLVEHGLLDARGRPVYS